MKKMLVVLLLCALCVPAYCVSLSVIPRAGAGMSWFSEPILNTTLNFAPGFSGGAVLELGFGPVFALRAGAAVKYAVISERMCIESWDVPPEPDIYMQDRSEYVFLEIPFAAVLYAPLSEEVSLYAAAGIKPAFVMSAKYETKAEDQAFSPLDKKGDLKLDNKCYAGIFIDAGTGWDAGPGRVLAGVEFDYYITGEELRGNILNLQLSFGYAFRL